MLNHLDEDKDFLGKYVFSDEATFHINGIVNRHSVSIWGCESHSVIATHHYKSENECLLCTESSKDLWTIFLRQESSDWDLASTHTKAVPYISAAAGHHNSILF